MGACGDTIVNENRGEDRGSLYSRWQGDREARTRARAIRGNPTEAESRLWRHIRQGQLGGHRFRRQQPIGNYIVDFYCHDRKLVIEVDGGHHQELQPSDDQRTQWLEAQGLRVLRFWNGEVLGNTEGVKQAILDTLEVDR